MYLVILGGRLRGLLRRRPNSSLSGSGEHGVSGQSYPVELWILPISGKALWIIFENCLAKHQSRHVARHNVIIPVLIRPSGRPFSMMRAE